MHGEHMPTISFVEEFWDSPVQAGDLRNEQGLWSWRLTARLWNLPIRLEAVFITLCLGSTESIPSVIRVSLEVGALLEMQGIHGFFVSATNVATWIEHVPP